MAYLSTPQQFIPHQFNPSKEGSFYFHTGGQTIQTPFLCGKNPIKTLEIWPKENILNEKNQRRAIKGNALEVLDDFLIQEGVWRDQEKGKRLAVGYFGYEFGQFCLKPPKKGLPLFNETNSSWPLAWLGIYENFSFAPSISIKTSSSLQPIKTKIRHQFSKTEYQQRVQKVLDYIHEGDLYQANIAQHFQFEAKKIIPAWDLFQSLLIQNPAPYSGFLSLQENKQLISCSPERFIKVKDNQILTEPIKGTVPCQTDEVLNQENIRWLHQSQKNLAELTMIIDLERNDLGKICQPGSIQVPQKASLHSFTSVHHLVAQVTGKLKNEMTPGKILQACFPGGSITGAPKIRAMEIIAALEQHARNAYTGSIGYFGPGKQMNFNIAIRSLMIDNKTATLHSGAGIVADSNPRDEYQETLAKVLPFFEIFQSMPKNDTSIAPPLSSHL